MLEISVVFWSRYRHRNRVSEISCVFLESVSASESGVGDLGCFFVESVSASESGVVDFECFSGVGIGIGIGCRIFRVFFWSRYRHRNRVSEISGVFLESVSASESGVGDFWCFSGVGIGIGIGCRRFLVFFWSRYRHRNRVS